MIEKNKQKKGFALWGKDEHRKACRLGGLAASANGNSHKFTSAEARKAGKVGGGVISKDREHMSRIGKRGAEVRNEKRAQRRREMYQAGSEVAAALREDG